MRTPIPSLVLLAGLTLGCATGYHPLVIPPNRCDQSPVCLRIHEQSWGRNIRVDEIARDNGLSVYRVSITNNGSEPVRLRPEDIRLQGSKELLTPEDAQVRGKMRVWPYIFWLPVMLTITSGSDAASGGGTVLPIGVPIGIGNMAYANNSNQKLLQDLKEKALGSMEIQPGESKAGLIYLHHATPSEIQLNLTLRGITSNQAFEVQGTF